MQVQKVQSHNKNFTALRINNPKIDWDPDVLLKFVKNKEIQKFVSGMDYMDRDIYASCINSRTIDMEVMRKKSDSRIGIQLPKFNVSEIENFSSHKSYQDFETLSGIKKIRDKKFEEALRIANSIVSGDSKAVEKNKKWWQFWK